MQRSTGPTVPTTLRADRLKGSLHTFRARHVRVEREFVSAEATPASVSATDVNHAVSADAAELHDSYVGVTLGASTASPSTRHVRTLGVPRVGVEPTLPLGDGVTVRSQPTSGFSAW